MPRIRIVFFYTFALSFLLSLAYANEERCRFARGENFLDDISNSCSGAVQSLENLRIQVQQVGEQRSQRLNALGTSLGDSSNICDGGVDSARSLYQSGTQNLTETIQTVERLRGQLRTFGQRIDQQKNRLGGRSRNRNGNALRWLQAYSNCKTRTPNGQRYQGRLVRCEQTTAYLRLQRLLQPPRLQAYTNLQPVLQGAYEDFDRISQQVTQYQRDLANIDASARANRTQLQTFSGNLTASNCSELVGRQSETIRSSSNSLLTNSSGPNARPVQQSEAVGGEGGNSTDSFDSMASQSQRGRSVRLDSGAEGDPLDIPGGSRNATPAASGNPAIYRNAQGESYVATDNNGGYYFVQNRGSNQYVQEISADEYQNMRSNAGALREYAGNFQADNEVNRNTGVVMRPGTGEETAFGRFRDNRNGDGVEPVPEPLPASGLGASSRQSQLASTIRQELAPGSGTAVRTGAVAGMGNREITAADGRRLTSTEVSGAIERQMRENYGNRSIDSILNPNDRRVISDYVISEANRIGDERGWSYEERVEFVAGRLARAQIESRFDPNQVSSHQAYGLTQIRPQTAQGILSSPEANQIIYPPGLNRNSPVQQLLRDPFVSMQMSTIYEQQIMASRSSYNDPTLTSMLYNCGEYCAGRGGRPGETVQAAQNLIRQGASQEQIIGVLRYGDGGSARGLPNVYSYASNEAGYTARIGGWLGVDSDYFNSRVRYQNLARNNNGHFIQAPTVGRGLASTPGR